MKFKQIINSFSAWTVDRLTSARRATLTMLATFLIAMTAQTAWAQDPATIGSISYNSTLGAYEINSVDNLKDLAVYVNGSGNYSTNGSETTSHNCKGLTFKMTADITFNTTVDNNFTPIGTIDYGFYGTFDGQGHTISGIRINKPSVDYIGVFGRLGTTTAGVVKNLVVRNCSIVADAHVGVIAGDLTGGESGTGIIENCHVGDDVTLKGHLFVGGIAGISNKATIEGCTCAATIEGTNSSGNNAYELGGIIGEISGGTSLIDNIFTGTISGDLKEYIGAIVGNNANGDLNNLGTNVYTSTGFDGIGAAGNPTPGTNPENKAKFAYLITAGKNVTVDFDGAAPADTQFGPNGISVYNKGMKYANYVVSYSTPVNLLLSYKPGFIVTGYTASTGTLTGTDHTGSNDAYTLANITGPSTITAIVDLWGDLTGDAKGTAEKPYILSSPEALDLLSEKVNGGTNYSGIYFKLGADIEYDPDVENNFTPIGNASNVFGGTFDGDGKTIRGLNINLRTTDYVGLFGCTNASSPTTIKGVKLDNSTITGQSYVGGILGGGGSSNTSILNCVVTSAVTVYGSVESVGGIVGKYATVRGCTSAAAVDGYHNVGGIIGNGYSSTVEYCLYTGNSVTARNPSTPNRGAIIGDKDNCSLTANYYTQATIGGSGSDGADEDGARKALTVTFPTNGTPSGTATPYNVSGITGYTGKSGYDDTTVNNIILYNDGTTSTYYSGAGETVTFLYNYDGYQVSVKDADAGKVDFTKDIKQTDATHIYHNHTFTMPAKAVTITATDVWGVAGGKDGSTADKAYTITTTEGLDLLAQNVNAGTGYSRKFFKLGADIEYNKNTANNFTPIGSNGNYFYGSFDGNGKTISGINIYNTTAEYQGVFGYLYGTVKNLVVSNCSIVARSSVGAIAGYLGIATIENCSVSNNVTLSGNSYVGGIAGSSSEGTIKGCVSAAAITGTRNAGNDANRLGGIAGAALTSSDSKVTDNLFTGTISDNLKEYIGAIVGQNANGTLTNNLYTSTGIGGIGAEGSATGADGDDARKAVEIIAAEGVTITPTGTKTTYNVSGITAYTDNNFIGYDSKLYAGATQAATFSIDYTEPEGYMFEGFDAGEGVGIVLNEGVYNLAVPASGNVTISPKLKDLTLTLDKIVEFETLAIDENMQSYVESGALKLKVTPKNKFWTLACGVDLLLPEGIVVYKARMNSAGTKVDLTEIGDSELNGVLKANNGVLIASTPGESYEFKVSPDNSVTTLSTADAKSYGNDNQLVPVLEETHFDSENYFILTDNQFVMVDVTKDTKVPVGKAVLKVPAGTAQARAFGIDVNDMTGDATGINAALENAGEEVWYNLQGQRISKPTRKGIYILNGKKVRM